VTPLLSLDDVSIGYGARPVLQGVSFGIARGELTALLGPNGAGKTTLLRGILGLIPLRTGRVTFGFDRAASPPGYVPQREALDPIFPLTVLEVVLMGTYAGADPLRPLGRRRRELAARSLEHVGLTPLAEQPFRSLSAGQKQRALIGRALAVEPQVLLLDEPTTGIDPGAERAITDLITRLHREQHLTVVLVSHNLRLVRELVETVVWVQDGVVTKGDPGTLLSAERVGALFGVGLG
jgi:ABC-type Mn2+/Zn2+ transport system ATPase subunit